MPKKKPHSKKKLSYLALLSGSVIFWQSNFLFADESIWYKSNDPLKTEAFTPPAIPDGYLDRPSCTATNYEAALTLADVAEAALCNNPQTREAYANARVQAAQVGIAKSAYLPSINDNVSTNLNVVARKKQGKKIFLAARFMSY